MSLPAVEIRRKAVHVSMGGFAFALRYLTFEKAALAALVAFGFNLLVLRRITGSSLDRESDRARGYSIGILLYPLVVLALLVLFRDRLEVAALGWGFLAFGDGFATVVGKSAGGPRLPWNAAKSWSGSLAYVLFAALSGGLLLGWVARRLPTSAELAAVVLAALIAAAVESLPSELDDNVLPPILGAVSYVLLAPALANLGALDGRQLLVALAINLVIAALSLALRIVRPSGAAAGFLFGTLVYGLAGWRPYVLLWIFFALGTLATQFGKRRKERLAKAEAAGGRRGAENVFANVSVAAFAAAVAGLTPDPLQASLLLLASAAAFATALADTIGTEVGQAIRSPTVLLPDFRSAAPGTDGAVSVAGTLAGLVAAALVAFAARLMGLVSAPGAVVVVIAAFAGSTAESLLGRDGAPWRVSNGHVLNFLNTLAGAVLAYAIGRLVLS